MAEAQLATLRSTKLPTNWALGISARSTAAAKSNLPTLLGGLRSLGMAPTILFLTQELKAESTLEPRAAPESVGSLAVILANNGKFDGFNGASSQIPILTRFGPRPALWRSTRIDHRLSLLFL